MELNLIISQKFYGHKIVNVFALDSSSLVELQKTQELIKNINYK
jgi:hypothetical protein